MPVELTKMLQGQRFIITRPHDRGLPLCNQIVSNGGEALLVPMVDIVKCSHELTIPDKSVVVFTSVYSVELADFDWGELNRCSIDIYAVGPSTAAALASRGIHAKLPRSYNSEGLIKLLEVDLSQHPLITNMVIAKGHAGRELLSQWCSSRTINCIQKIIYQRQPTAVMPDVLVNWLRQQDEFQLTVICTSVEAIQLWLEAMSELDIKSGIGQVEQPPLIVCSDRMVEAANKLHLPVMAVAKDCHNDALFAAITSQAAT